MALINCGEIMDYMKLALEEAKKAYNIGEVPVGAIIVKNGEILARAHNIKETIKSPIAHAEIVAIQRACEFIGDWRLNGADMYVTLEPCAMCTAAIANARISNLYIGTFNIDMGSCGTVFNLLDYDIFNTKININWLYNEDCRNILTDFFQERRNKKNSNLDVDIQKYRRV